MKKRITAAVSILVLLVTLAAVFVYGFPERFFVSGSVDSIASIEVNLKRDDRTAIVTARDDIEAFYQALGQSSGLKMNMFVAHSEGLHSDPVYTLEVFYQNGSSVYFTTSEGGNGIYRFFDENHRGGGDKGYIYVRNTALYDWVKSVV